jgi:hypothetical protein
MTSAINPNNIDGTYPVAGQDNNSQGFRDNFTNTKTNFQYAADEISELQNKALLKQSLTGETLVNDLSGNSLINGVLDDFALSYLSLGTPGTSSIPVDYSLGHFQQFTMSASRSISFANWPASGNMGVLWIQVDVQTAGITLTLPNSVNINNVGIVGAFSDAGGTVITFAATGIYTFQFISVNAGASITMFDNNTALRPFNNSFDLDIPTGTAIDLSTTSTCFITGASGETSTLADGVDGQIKVLIMRGDGGGNMVVTVASPGWNGGGTITFDTYGQACTLQFIQDAWFAISTNNINSGPTLN